MNKTIIIILIVLAIGGVGGFLLLPKNAQNNVMEQKKMVTEAIDKSESMMEKKQEKKDIMRQKESGMMNSYTGTTIAGKASPYIEFNQPDYEKAVKEKQIIFLEFYANWCPICRAQAPKLAEGFDALNDEQVIGFRVNYNDDATDESEKQLAKDFGVTYQHTHVILKNGKVVAKSNDELDKNDFEDLIESVKK